jgi:hypothetical protein
MLKENKSGNQLDDMNYDNNFINNKNPSPIFNHPLNIN